MGYEYNSLTIEIVMPIKDVKDINKINYSAQQNIIEWAPPELSKKEIRAFKRDYKLRVGR